MEKCFADALAQSKRMGRLLNEVLDLSHQLAEAADRNDQVSVEMLVAMRREPVEKLAETDQALRELVLSAPDGDAGAHLAGLLEGGEAEGPEEQALAEQVAANSRRLKQVLDLDRALNQKLTREKSVYQ